MTLVGCLINESDYRRAHELGKGGIDGLRTGHDFVLVDAGSASTQSATSGGSCTEKGTGKAYRLAGNREGELKPLVGRYVEITGRFEHGHDESIDAGDKQAHLPAEIVVASFREVTPVATPAPAPSTTAAVPDQPAPSEPAPSAPASTAPVATTGELPATASAQPLIAMIALLCLCAAVAVRFVRRRAL